MTLTINSKQLPCTTGNSLCTIYLKRCWLQFLMTGKLFNWKSLNIIVISFIVNITNDYYNDQLFTCKSIHNHKTVIELISKRKSSENVFQDQRKIQEIPNNYNLHTTLLTVIAVQKNLYILCLARHIRCWQ